MSRFAVTNMIFPKLAYFVFKFFLECLLCSGVLTSDFVRYKKIINKSIADASKPSLQIIGVVTPFKVTNWVDCPLRCNRISECQIATLDEDTYQCSLFSNLTTLLDLIDLKRSLMLCKSPIKECLNEDYFADSVEQVNHLIIEIQIRINSY